MKPIFSKTAVIILGILVLVSLAIWGNYKRGGSKISVETKRSEHEPVVVAHKKTSEPSKEYHTIYTFPNWIQIKTDPEKESFKCGITDKRLEFYLVVNGNFARPYKCRGDSEYEDLPEEIRTIHFSLTERQNVDQ